MMTSIGLLIVFGSIFGDFLGNSGATEELAKGMVRLFGKKNDYLALNLVGFILSIPIYFGCSLACCFAVVLYNIHTIAIQSFFHGRCHFLSKNNQIS